MTELSPQDRYPYPEFEEYITYVATFRTSSRNTINAFNGRLTIIGRYFRDVLGIKAITELTPEHVNAMLDHHLDKWANETLKLSHATLHRFIKWAIKERKIKSFEMPPYPEKLVPVRATPEIVMPQTIFRMRQVSDVRIDAVAAIELMLSSGMRIGEVEQLRACDLKFGESPHDISTGKLSAYVGGSILLRKEQFRLKTGRSRVVFFSKLAATRLKIYMEHVGIRVGGRTLLFPLRKDVREQWYIPIKAAIPELNKRAPSVSVTGKKVEVDEADLEGLSEKMKAMMYRNAARANAFVGSVDPVMERAQVSTYEGLHSHQFRHSFTCFQFYRDYYGTRNSMQHLMSMLGHSSITMTVHYLSQLCAVKNDAEWAQLWLGRPTDWSRTKELKWKD